MRSPGIWRGLRSLFAVLLLVAFAAGPTLDRLLCTDEALPTFETSTTDLAMIGGEAPEGGAHDANGRCDHGHCHHGGGFVTATAALINAPYPQRQIHTPAFAGLPPADMKFGLKRPPRA